VVAALPRMALLRRLRLAFEGDDPHPDEADVAEELMGSFAGLSALQHLALEGVVLPRGRGTPTIGQLTGLTALHLLRCCPGETLQFAELADLRDLRELSYQYAARLDEGDSDGEGASFSAPPSALEVRCTLSRLTRLTALALRSNDAHEYHGGFVRPPCVAEVCSAMPQLRRLDLSGNSAMYGAVAFVALLTNLEELDLSETLSAVDIITYLRPPASLRRCVLRELCASAAELRKLREGLGRHVEVVW
jgi:hypothetical protein